jgi:hypothetical protein
MNIDYPTLEGFKTGKGREHNIRTEQCGKRYWDRVECGRRSAYLVDLQLELPLPIDWHDGCRTRIEWPGGPLIVDDAGCE